MTQENNMPRGRERPEKACRTEELKEALLAGLRTQAGEAAEAEARAFLEDLLEDVCRNRPDDTEAFIDQLVVRSVPYIQKHHDMYVRHLRLIGISHVLVNVLRPIAEESDDELISTRFEMLRDRLFNLERVDGKSISVDNRLISIYDGLVELAGALCITSCRSIEG